MVRYVLIIFLLLSSLVAFAEEDDVRVVSFSELQNLMAVDNDTLYVVNFWATWCKPCVTELPYFEELTTNYASKKLKVILLSLDFEDRIQSKLLPFINGREIKSEVILLQQPRGGEWIDEINPEWSGAIPATVIYRNSDALNKFYEQAFTSEELDNIVKQLLKKQ